MSERATTAGGERSFDADCNVVVSRGCLAGTREETIHRPSVTTSRRTRLLASSITDPATSKELAERIIGVLTNTRAMLYNFGSP